MNNDRPNFLGVMNVVERIRIEKKEIGELAPLDGPL
jgi:hypothetical protein